MTTPKLSAGKSLKNRHTVTVGKQTLALIVALRRRTGMGGFESRTIPQIIEDMAMAGLGDIPGTIGRKAKELASFRD